MHMARYCHEMLFVTLMEEHAGNICMRLDSPTSWISAHQSTLGILTVSDEKFVWFAVVRDAAIQMFLRPFGPVH